MTTVKFYSGLDSDTKSTIQNSVAWKAMCAGYCYLPGSEEYYNEYHNNTFLVKTFIVFKYEVPILIFPCTIKENKLSWFHFSANFFEEPCSIELRLEAYRSAFSFLDKLKEEFQIKELAVEFNSFLIAEFFNNISKVETAHYGIIDYNFTDEQIKSNVRKSYKSLINWGQRNLEICITDKNSPDKAKYDEFKEFHILTSGRKTRSDRSWDIHYDMLVTGNAYLISAYYEGKIASNVFVLHGFTEGFYGVGVNDRQLMENKLAISHYPLLKAIYHGRELGLKYFNMNQIDKNGIDDKVNNIAKFKQGFSNIIVSKTEYLLDLNS